MAHRITGPERDRVKYLAAYKGSELPPSDPKIPWSEYHNRLVGRFFGLGRNGVVRVADKQQFLNWMHGTGYVGPSDEYRIQLFFRQAQGNFRRAANKRRKEVIEERARREREGIVRYKSTLPSDRHFRRLMAEFLELDFAAAITDDLDEQTRLMIRKIDVWNRMRLGNYSIDWPLY